MIRQSFNRRRENARSCRIVGESSTMRKVVALIDVRSPVGRGREQVEESCSSDSFFSDLW